MELAQALSNIPIERQVEIARQWGLPIPRHSKRLLGDGIAAYFRNPKTLVSVVEQLSREEVQVLHCCLLLGPGKAKLDDLINVFHPHGHNESSINLESAVLSLLQKGVLYPDGEFHLTETFFLPSDLKRSLFSLLIRENEDIPHVPPGSPDEVLSRPNEFLDDLFSFVSVAAADRVRLTGDGTMFKRSLEKLVHRFRVPVDTGLQRVVFQARNLPTRFEILFESLQALRLIRENHGYLEVGPRWREWLQKSRTEMTLELLRHVEGKLIKNDYQLRSLFGTLSGFAEPDEWVSSRRILRDTFGFSAKNSVLEKGLLSKGMWLLQLLMNLGLYEIAHFAREQVVAARPTELGAAVFSNVPLSSEPEDPGVTIQPNFDVLVPPEVSFRTRWELERIASARTQDVVSTYHLSRNALYLGFKAGFSREEMERFLAQRLAKPCPQNVLHTLNRWAERYGEVTFTEGLLLQCRSAELAEAIAHLPEVAPYIKATLTPHDLLVDREHYDSILEALEMHGYMPAPKPMQ